MEHLKQKKRALIVGINYAGTDSELKGCINDAKNVRRLLVTRFGYAETDITELLEGDATRAALMKEFKKLLASGADRMFFSYSGHGGYELCERQRKARAARGIVDREPGETDGRDETLVPYDYRVKGEVVDDELRSAIIAAKLRPHQQLVALFDSCHSGSGLDLAYSLSAGPLSLRKNRVYPLTAARVILLSGCEDAQTSADTREDGENQGALTFSFLNSLEAMEHPTWGQLYIQTRLTLREHKYTQIPCLTAGKWFSLSEEFTL